MWLRLSLALVLLAVAAPGTASAAPPQLANLLTTCNVFNGVTVCTGQVPSFDGAPLDVDVTFPTQQSRSPKPLIVMLHGYGGDKRDWESTTDEGDGADKYHWNSHWFARHGYYVLTYTARGFPSRPGPSAPYQPATPGGTSLSAPNGTIHLKSRDIEVRDTQWLAALVAAAYPEVDEKAVAVTGGSYGGGEAWLQASQGTWTFPHELEPSLPVLELQVAVPKYSWTDFAYGLAPHGHGGGPSGTDIYESAYGRPPNDTGIGNPVGVAKLSWIGAFFFVVTPSRGGVLESGSRVTPSEEGPINLSAWLFRLLNVGEPYDVAGAEDPVVAQLRRGLTRFRGSYYQTAGWAAQVGKRETAIFAIQGWTDDLFEAVEPFRQFKYLKRLDPRWPVEVAMADIGHSRGQNKPATWHRLNKQAWQFLQAHIKGSHRQQTTVSSEPTLCANDGDPDENFNASQRLTATTPEGLSEGTLTVRYSSPGTLNYLAGAAEPNGATSDPLGHFSIPSLQACRTEVPIPPIPGATYSATSQALSKSLTYVGLGEVQVPYTLAGTSAHLDVRVWDVAPAGGPSLLMTRGTYRLSAPFHDSNVGVLRLPLFGNHWKLQPGHRIRIHLTQADYPFLRPASVPSQITFAPPTLVLPTRQAGATVLAGS